MIQIRYTSILLWSVHDKAARAAHLPARRLSSLLPRVLAGRGNLLASLLPPVLEDLAPCGRPLTNPEARRSLPVPVGPPGGAPQATLRVGLHDKSATPALGLSANDAPRARETGTCARREVGVSQQKGKCDRTSRGRRGLSLSRATREGGVASGNKARRQHSGLLTASEGSVRGAADGRSLSSPLFRPTSSALRCRSRSIDRERERALVSRLLNSPEVNTEAVAPQFLLMAFVLALAQPATLPVTSLVCVLAAAALITTPFIMALLPPRSLCTTFVPRRSFAAALFD